MTRNHLITTAVAIAISSSPVAAQSSEHPHLHINPRWKECSFQLDPSLTQAAWRQFTREAGVVSYFRPLTSAQPMGRGKLEVSVLQYDTGIDDHDAAWNDTFVHPDAEHWLFEGSGLKFPGLTLRAGVSAKTDVGVYLTKNPNANYGFYGAQVQHNLAGGADREWNASARVSFVSMYGPEDLDFSVYGADLVASRKIAVTGWADLSPYAGVSTYLARSHEKAAAVRLDDEHALGAQAMIGAELRVSHARIAAEYSAASVRSISLKIGLAR
jgi:hypothetical protein